MFQWGWVSAVVGVLVGYSITILQYVSRWRWLLVVTISRHYPCDP